jgi:4-diphosphocytidyl-2-C-methyl-D-erythritol kinase
LRILGKRADGYHEIWTVLQTISLCDDLHFLPAPENAIQLTCSDPEIPTDEKNLIFRAAKALQQETGINSGCRIHLDKRIPTKAGLGGGSSNAAVALLGLSRLWQLELTRVELMGIAAEIGADVPFFLIGGTAEGTGTGSTVSLLPDVPQRHLLLITPKANVSTFAAYEAFDRAALTLDLPETILAGSRKESRFDDSDLWDLKNDFERVIFDIEPEMKRASDALLSAGAVKTLLAGSGSTVFGIFDDLDARVRASGVIKAEAGWRVFPCVTISRNDYLRAVNTE